MWQLRPDGDLAAAEHANKPTEGDQGAKAFRHAKNSIAHLRQIRRPQESNYSLVMRPPLSGASLTGRERGRLIGKIISWSIGILIVVWIVSRPVTAGNDVHMWISDIVSFFSHLASG